MGADYVLHGTSPKQTLDRVGEQVSPARTPASDASTLSPDRPSLRTMQRMERYSVPIQSDVGPPMPALCGSSHIISWNIEGNALVRSGRAAFPHRGRGQWRIVR